jgi:hypothetical protein
LVPDVTTKGNPFIKVRVEPELRDRAVAAFPSERGKKGGLSAELLAFLTFIGEHPDAWAAIKQSAADRSADPWTLISEAVAAYKP